MKKYKNKTKKVFLEKYNFGDKVEIFEGMHYYYSAWASEHGLLPGTGRYFTKKEIGKFIKTSPDSGQLYNIIDVENELFEVFHKQIKKV